MTEQEPRVKLGQVDQVDAHETDDYFIERVIIDDTPTFWQIPKIVENVYVRDTAEQPATKEKKPQPEPAQTADKAEEEKTPPPPMKKLEGVFRLDRDTGSVVAVVPSSMRPRGIDAAAKIGKRNIIGMDVAIVSSASTGDDVVIEQKVALEDNVSVKDRARVRQRAVMRSGSTAEEDSFIGASSVIGTDSIVEQHARVPNRGVVRNNMIFKQDGTSTRRPREGR